MVKKLTNSNAGNGLFAVVNITKSEVVDDRRVRAGKKGGACCYTDRKDYGAYVSRISFAAKKINRMDRHF